MKLAYLFLFVVLCVSDALSSAVSGYASKMPTAVRKRAVSPLDFSSGAVRKRAVSPLEFSSGAVRKRAVSPLELLSGAVRKRSVDVAEFGAVSPFDSFFDSPDVAAVRKRSVSGAVSPFDDEESLNYVRQPTLDLHSNDSLMRQKRKIKFKKGPSLN